PRTQAPPPRNAAVRPCTPPVRPRAVQYGFPPFRRNPPMPATARMRSTRALSAALLLLSPALAAAQQCDSSALSETPPAGHFRVDNDLRGGEKQDQGYTNGAMLTLVSPNRADYPDDPCLPGLARWLNRYLERLQPGGFEQQN